MYKKLFVMLVLSLLTVGLSTAPASASSSHTGSKNAVHMELKNSRGHVVCSAYNTSASSKPVAHNCAPGIFTEQLFDANWRQIAPNKVVAFGGKTAPPTIDVYVSGPAVHVEVKDSANKIVCHAYNTSPRSAPLVRDCPVGDYTVVAFDSNWKQIEYGGVLIRAPRPS